jgi:hypothetical protein
LIDRNVFRPTRFSDELAASYYFTDNFKLSLGHVYTVGTNFLTLGSEHGFALGGGRMASLFTDGALGEHGIYSARAGLRVYFGQRDKSLMDRHRQDDPPSSTNLGSQILARQVSATLGPLIGKLDSLDNQLTSLQNQFQTTCFGSNPLSPSQQQSCNSLGAQLNQTQAQIQALNSEINNDANFFQQLFQSASQQTQRLNQTFQNLQNCINQGANCNNQ